jgi:hypothetical protein
MTTHLQELLPLLKSIASYNDKGCEWSAHSSDRIRSEQTKAQAKIEKIVSSLSADALPVELRAELLSGMASTDASGIYCEKVQQCVSKA